jgi:hypothetical protein
MDIHSYEEQLETLSLLKTYVVVRPETQTGEAYSMDEAIAELRRRRAGQNAGLEPALK